MHKILLVKLKLWVIILFGCNSLFAQEASSTQPESFFNKSIGQQSRLFNGKEYQFYLPSIEGVAYFQEATFFSPGSVTYDGILYENVPLMYDLNKDLLISLLYDGYSKYSLITEKVGSFNLHEHHFVYLNIDSTHVKSPIRSGFFDQIYKGKLEVLVKRTKVLKESSGTRDLKKYFLAKNSYYLGKGDTYYSISSERSLMNLFKDRKKELQRYLKEKNVKFRNDPEHAMVVLATYYDLLSN